MFFKSIQVRNWRQFRRLDIELHPKLTILTGANGAGKTTILNLLSRHFGWQGTLVSTPRRRSSGASEYLYSTDLWNEDWLAKFGEWLQSDQETVQAPAPPIPQGNNTVVGSITYTSGAKAEIHVPDSVSSTFQVSLHNEQEVHGLYIPSHRPVVAYQRVENIPCVPRKRHELFDQYINIFRQRYYGGHHQRVPQYFIKESLIALATFGYGNQVVEADKESLEIFEAFEETLRIVLPRSLGFQRIAIRLPEVVLITKTGDFSLDAVSGGVAALIDLAWQIFTYSRPDRQKYVVTIDEPENHLHPELQRTVLGSLVTAFPNVQFVCATHNPFIVTSVPDSRVYVLRYGEDHRVITDELNNVDRTGTANEILRDVLGLDSTSPVWVEDKLKTILDSISGTPITTEALALLRKLLQEAGLGKFTPEALTQLADRGSGS